MWWKLIICWNEFNEGYDGIKRAFALGDIVTEDIVSAANDYQVIRDRILDTIFV